MNVKCPIWFSIATVILSGSASFADEVKTDWDRNADFKQFKTYSWEQVHTRDPLWGDRIQAVIDSTLAPKGWTNIASGGDVSIVMMEGTETRRTPNSDNQVFDGGWGWRWGGGFGSDIATTPEKEYKVGTLVVRLFDRKSKRLIWCGSTTHPLFHGPDENVRHLSRSVQKLFDHFPPNTAQHN